MAARRLEGDGFFHRRARFPTSRASSRARGSPNTGHHNLSLASSSITSETGENHRSPPSLRPNPPRRSGDEDVSSSRVAFDEPASRPSERLKITIRNEYDHPCRAVALAASRDQPSRAHTKQKRIPFANRLRLSRASVLVATPRRSTSAPPPPSARATRRHVHRRRSRVPRASRRRLAPRRRETRARCPRTDRGAVPAPRAHARGERSRVGRGATVIVASSALVLRDERGRARERVRRVRAG